MLSQPVWNIVLTSVQILIAAWNMYFSEAQSFKNQFYIYSYKYICLFTIHTNDNKKIIIII